MFSITAVSPSGIQLGLIQYFGYAEKTALINYCKRFKIKNRKEYTFAIAYEKWGFIAGQKTHYMGFGFMINSNNKHCPPYNQLIHVDCMVAAVIYLLQNS